MAGLLRAKPAKPLPRDETAPARAKRGFRETFAGVGGGALALLFGAAGAAGSTWVSEGRSLNERVFIAFAFVIVGGLAAASLWYLVLLLTAPYRQRDEARAEVAEATKEVAELQAPPPLPNISVAVASMREERESEPRYIVFPSVVITNREKDRSVSLELTLIGSYRGDTVLWASAWPTGFCPIEIPPMQSNPAPRAVRFQVSDDVVERLADLGADEISGAPLGLEGVELTLRVYDRVSGEGFTMHVPGFRHDRSRPTNPSS